MFGGNCRTSPAIASAPPAEAPTTTMSRRALCKPAGAGEVTLGDDSGDTACSLSGPCTGRVNRKPRAAPSAAHLGAQVLCLLKSGASFVFDIMHTERIIVIGASAGGVQALEEVVSRLPGDLAAAV